MSENNKEVMEILDKLRKDALQTMNTAETDWEQGYASGVMAAIIYIEAKLKYGYGGD